MPCAIPRAGAVQCELARLADSGPVTASRVGTQKHFQANPKSPIFSELCAISQKTVGLKPLAKRISAAFVYGSVAKRQDTAASDIDLTVVSGSLTYADLFAALEDASERLGRKVNPAVYSPRELAKRVKQGNAFVTRVLAQPKIWLVGGESDIAA
jgi:predicted nucleotidyltransferase